ncbi:hypothetical protein DFQ27_006869 [Actinomortierella ambigua]|uniref:Mitochondrial carrier n=1 Tax=Actinomortierella ambigua TaxID=1343610 RepID=A0A9P6QHT9_9FUNG|nr:hypothetical protein DFQ27_006869 [Actinomortierella ambigua]
MSSPLQQFHRRQQLEDLQQEVQLQNAPLAFATKFMKTRLQLQVAPHAQARSSFSAITTNAITSTRHATHRPYFSSILDTLVKSTKADYGATRGWLSLYRGMGSLMLLEAPKRGFKFTVFEQWSIVLKKLFSTDQLSVGQVGLVGALAGASEAFFVVPFELVKVRLQDPLSSPKYAGASAEAGRPWRTYSNSVQATRRIWRQEGILAFSRGLEATFWRNSSWSAMYFGTIHAVRLAFPERPSHPLDKHEKMAKSFVAGTLGGLLGTLVSSPFDVVKSRIQSCTGNRLHVAGRSNPWAWSAIWTLLRQEGYRAPFKGLGTKLLRLGPGGGILLVVFDQVTHIFKEQLDSPAATVPAAANVGEATIGGTTFQKLQ